MKSLSVAERLYSSKSALSYCDTILFAFQTGKLREMLHFAVLEIYYWWCQVFRVSSRLIEFRQTPFLRYRPEDCLVFADLAATLRFHNLFAVETPTKWSIITDARDGTIFGTTLDRPHVLQRSENLCSTPVEMFVFSRSILAIFISDSGHLFVATKGRLYRSEDDGRHFDVALRLSHDDSFVWHNHGIDETPEGLVVGEYGSIVDRNRTPSFWKPVAHLYLTRDCGKSWRCIDYLVRNGASKHVHLVKYSRRFGQLLVTEGDSRKRSYWISSFKKLEDGNLNEGRFDSFSWGGGHTAFAETPNATLLGTDHHGGTNSIICLRSCGEGRARMLPSPYRRSPVMNMHCIKCGARSILFASLQSGLRDQKSALIYSDDNGGSWHRLVEFNGSYGYFSISNGQQTLRSSLVVSFDNFITKESKTIVISAS
jgi:hypothetical protein